MYLNLYTRRSSEFPYLTLGELTNLVKSNVPFCNFKLIGKFTRCADMRLKITENYQTYHDLIKRCQDNKSDINLEWNKLMLDIDWDNLCPMKYPEEIESTLIEISIGNYDNIKSLILLCKSLRIELTYVNKDTDLVKVSDECPYCTKRMIKYFPNQLTEIPRLEYQRLREVNKWYAIRSGNKYYKNIHLDDSFIHNSVPSV